MDTSSTYTFDWRPAEHAAVTRLLVRDQFTGGLARVFRWVVFVVVFLAILLSAISAGAGDLGPAVRLGPIAAIVTVFLLFFDRIAAWLRAWQMKRSDPNVTHPFTYTLSDECLTLRLHTVKAELQWTGMHQVRETPEFFLFYYDRRSAYFLPKRAISRGELAALPMWIRARLPESVPYTSDVVR